MKRLLILNMLACILLAVSALALFAQDHHDDQGIVNNPAINPRANACYSGGTLAGTCITAAQWECGWYLIRFEGYLIERQNIPSRCDALLPVEATHEPADHATSEPTSPSDHATPEPTHEESTAQPSPTATYEQHEFCSWAWATRPAPELAQRVQTNINAAGIANVSVTATIYGEDCRSSVTGEVLHFGEMFTQFSIEIVVEQGVDTSTYDATVRSVINSIPRSEIPGPMSIGISIKIVTVAHPVSAPAIEATVFPIATEEAPEALPLATAESTP